MLWIVPQPRRNLHCGSGHSRRGTSTGRGRETGWRYYRDGVAYWRSELIAQRTRAPRLGSCLLAWSQPLCKKTNIEKVSENELDMSTSGEVEVREVSYILVPYRQCCTEWSRRQSWKIPLSPGRQRKKTRNLVLASVSNVIKNFLWQFHLLQTWAKLSTTSTFFWEVFVASFPFSSSLSPEEGTDMASMPGPRGEAVSKGPHMAYYILGEEQVTIEKTTSIMD